MMREGISGTVVLGTRAELFTIQSMFGSAPATNGKLRMVEFFLPTPQKTYMEPENDGFQPKKYPFSRGPGVHF